MRIPKIKYRENNDTRHEIHTIDIPKDTLKEVHYYPDIDFEDEKSVERYTKICKSLIRKSRSYKDMMANLKYNMDMNSCFFFPNIKRERGSKISIEMHHTGLVMEDIINAVLYKRYEEGESLNACDVAKEVMLQHYKGNISLTALSTTAHDLIHEVNSTLFIPLGMEDFGNITLFFEEYKPYIKKHMNELYKKFETYKMVSDTVENISDIIPEFMDLNIIYYNCEGVELPKMDAILDIINSDD